MGERLSNQRQHSWGMDADAIDHAQTSIPDPDLRTSKARELGRIYGPRGETVHVVRAPRPPFGFTPEDAG